MIQISIQLKSLLNKGEHRRLAVLLMGLVIRAGVEMVGVASIMPFMSVVANPDIVQTNRYLSAVYSSLEFASTTSFLTFLGFGVVVMLAVANSVSALAQYCMLRFSWGMHHRISTRLLKGYLGQPYQFFTHRNSASLSKSLLSEVHQSIAGVLIPLLDASARLVVVMALIALLIVIDPVLAILVALVLGGTYGTVYLAIKKKQRRLGIERVQSNRERYKVSNEAFGGIKDVKVLQREQEFVRRFASVSWRFSKAASSNAVISALPKYFIETIAFGGIVLIVLYYLRAGHDVAQILPVMSLYAFAGYRLMPEMQKLFANVTKLRFNRAALDDLLEDYYAVPDFGETATPHLPFEQAITFDEARFTYPGAETPALDGASLRIQKNHTIGLVGASGSGKTTLVDLLLGLYDLEMGQILIDDTPLNEQTARAWRKRVGYVPQHIFLTDDSIARNIAFGLPDAEIDKRKVERAARIAHLHAFIQTLPDGYDTVVGERGVRLSGGQRQRIGIARALYHDPDLLIMDEATSALDGATEDAVMRAIHELAGRKTIVLIAHRLTTVKECDCIYVFDKGRIVDQGTYQELEMGSSTFRIIAKLAPTEIAHA